MESVICAVKGRGDIRVWNQEIGLTVSSRAKINWTLEVLGKRPDGYHELRTLLQTVNLADTLTLTPVDSGISIGCDHPEVPLDERNLVHRAARLLLEHTGIERGVRIEITKRIPTAAGLGGGSSNAAATLLALCQLWGLDLKLSELVTLGSRIGADVPFFFFGGTCLGVGRGDEVYPVGEITADFMLLVNGGILVPSGDVYANLPPHLTSSSVWASRPMPVTHQVVCETSRRAATPALLLNQQLGQQLGQELGQQSGQQADWMRNDLELPVLAKHPRIAAVRQQLLNLGACNSMMSGSGSTVFAVFDDDRTRQQAAEILRQDGWWCAPVRTVTRNDHQ